MKKTIRPAIFKWRQTELELILCAARWRLRHSLPLRDVEELPGECGLAEAMHRIRKEKAKWVNGSDVRRQIQFINQLFEVVA